MFPFLLTVCPEQGEIIAHWTSSWRQAKLLFYIYAQKRPPLTFSMDSLRIKIPVDIIQGAKISSVVNSTRGEQLVSINQLISKELFERINNSIPQVLKLVL